MSEDLQHQLRSHVEFLARAPRNGRTSPAHLQAGLDYAARHLTSSGWHVSSDTFTRRHVLGISDNANPWWTLGYFPTLTGTNLLAQWGETGPTTVIVAHIDTVGRSPGADDNASGVAAAITAGQIIAHSGTVHRTLIALVDLEETGHQGSKRLARQLRDQHLDVAGVICLESIGYFDHTPGTQRLPGLFRRLLLDPSPNRPVPADFMAVVCRRTSQQLATDWAEHANRYGLDTLRFLDRRHDGLRAHAAIAFRPQLAHLDRSDHASFQDVGIPAICVSDTPPLRSPHYHQTATDQTRSTTDASQQPPGRPPRLPSTGLARPMASRRRPQGVSGRHGLCRRIASRWWPICTGRASASSRSGVRPLRGTWPGTSLADAASNRDGTLRWAELAEAAPLYW